MATKMKARELRALDGDRIRERMQGQRADRVYLTSHYRELLEKYQNQWVVISGGKLVKIESDPTQLVETLSGTRREDMLVFFLADPEETLIL